MQRQAFRSRVLTAIAAGILAISAATVVARTAECTWTKIGSDLWEHQCSFPDGTVCTSWWTDGGDTRIGYDCEG